jgi:predicted dehydrogenase
LRAARSRGLKHGAVEDKIFLPGLQKLSLLAKQGFFGRITGFALEFGWWVFDGAERPSQRPSWNYKREGGGGLISDMYPHWRYIIENILGPIYRVTATATTALPERVDELGERYRVDVDDTSITLVELTSGVVGTMRCSWATRVRRDDLFTLQIDGTGGSAVAGLHRCRMQSASDTPTIRHINPGTDVAENYRGAWKEVPASETYVNPYRMGWEAFIRHVTTGAPLVSDLSAGLRDVQLAEACYLSVSEKKWVEVGGIVN